MRFSIGSRILTKNSMAASLCALLSGFMPHAAISADATSEALEGAWVVSVGDERRERFLIVSGARTDQGKVTVKSTSYNWIDGRDSPVKDWNCEVFGDELRLRFVTGAGSLITVAFRADETTAGGTFLRKDGAVRELRMTRIPPEELAELRASAKMAATAAKAPPAQNHAAPGSKMYLVYVGANDCPSCRGYEVEYFGRKELMAKVIPDFAKIEYINSNIGSYKNRERVGPVPDALKWLAGNDRSGKPLLKRRGVPFFALVVDDKIWAQGHGTTALETLLAPEIKRAVAEKYAAR